MSREFRSCLVRGPSVMELRRCRSFGRKFVSAPSGIPSRYQLIVGVGLPPYTSHFNLIISPSLYGPTTDVRSVFDSSFILIRSGGTVEVRRTRHEEKAQKKLFCFLIKYGIKYDQAMKIYD